MSEQDKQTIQRWSQDDGGLIASTEGSWVLYYDHKEIVDSQALEIERLKDKNDQLVLTIESIESINNMLRIDESRRSAIMCQYLQEMRLLRDCVAVADIAIGGFQFSNVRSALAEFDKGRA